MGFLRSLFAQTYERAPSSDYWYYPVGEITQAGVRITRDRLLKISSVLQGVRFPSQTVAGLPRFVFRTLEDGRSKEKEVRHPLNRVLRYQPNAWQTAFQFVESMTSRAMLDGMAIAEKIYDGETVTALIPLEPTRVVAIDQRANGMLRYSYRRADGSTRTLMQEEVFVLCGFGDGLLRNFCGIPIGDMMRETAGLELAVETYGASFFGNSAMPRVVLQSPNEIKQATRERMKADWQLSYGGERQHGTALLEAGTDVKVLSTKNDEAQFIETRKSLVGEFSRFTDVTPHRLHDLEKSSYNNVEQMSLESVVYGLTPWVERWEQACYRDLLNEDDKEAGRFVEFVLEGLLRGDTAARAQLYQSGVNTGWLTRNEVREKENLNPIEGLDDPLQPVNMVPVGQQPVVPAPPTNGNGTAPPESEDEDEESSEGRRAYAIARAAAERVIRKEIAAVNKCRENSNGGAQRQIEAFYHDHAPFVAQALAMDSARAERWCSERLKTVIMGRSGVVPGLESEDAVEYLAREALQ